MPSRPIPIRAVPLLAAGLVLVGQAQAAGTVNVGFTQPEGYTDIGLGPLDRERHLKRLSEHMQRWSAELPDGQTLQIEVLDVDLAGELRPWHSRPDVRILKGTIDWPRMNLRWTLKAGDQVLRSGEDRLSDPAYLSTSARLRYPGELAYDVRMLDDWLQRRVLATAPASR